MEKTQPLSEEPQRTTPWTNNRPVSKTRANGRQTTTTLALPKDLQGALKLKWAPYAGRNLTYFLAVMHLRETYGKLYEKLLGIRFSHLFVEGNGGQWQMYRSPSESERLENFVYERTKDATYVQDILERTGKGFETYRDHAQRQRRVDYFKADSKTLAEALQAERQAYLGMIVGVSCAIIFASALARRLQETVPEEAVAQMALPLHMTLPLEEEIGFWKLVEKVQGGKINNVKSFDSLPKSLQADVASHFESYCWLDAYETDPVWKMDDLLDRINEAVMQNAKDKVRQLEQRHDQNERQAHAAARKFGIGAQQLQQFRLAMYYRILGESQMGLANLSARPLYSAIAKKLLLPKNQLKWFSDTELLDALNGTVTAESLLEKLPARQKHYLVALGDKDVHCFQGADVDAVLAQLDIEKPNVADVTEIKGVSAYPGKVTGIARVINHVGELDKVLTGDILVTLNTTPSFILAMKRSAAIVTDEGGITCHAAIVSRELGIPCIIGTKAGTKLIQDGSRIEVDAAKGTVTKLDA